MKAWQLTTGLAVIAIAAGQLPLREIADDAPPIRARLDTVVGTSEYGFVGLEERPSLDRVEYAIHHDPDIEACFADARRDLGPLPDLMVRFHVGPTGSVDDAALTIPAQLQRSSLDACLSRGLEAMHFQPADGTGITFHLPFKF